MGRYYGPASWYVCACQGAPTAVAASTAATASGATSARLPPGDGTLYVTITGNRQGAFMTEAPQGFVARGMTFDLNAPVSTAGVRTGRRNWSALTLSIEWCAATPQLMSALINNEQLTVKIGRRRPGGVPPMRSASRSC